MLKLVHLASIRFFKLVSPLQIQKVILGTYQNIYNKNILVSFSSKGPFDHGILSSAIGLQHFLQADVGMLLHVLAHRRGGDASVNITVGAVDF